MKTQSILGLMNTARGLVAALVILGAILSASPAPAQSGAASPAVIIVVDMNAVMRDSKVGKSLQEQRDKFYDALDDRIKKKDKEFQAQVQELTNQRSLFTEEVMQQKLDELRKKAEKENEGFQKERLSIDAGVFRAQQKIERALRPIFAELMQQKAATMILDRRSIIAGGVDEDVTAEVVQRLNQRLEDVTVEKVDIDKLQQQQQQKQGQ